jgi:hypothetical protein
VRKKNPSIPVLTTPTPTTMQNDIQEVKQDKDDADTLAHREEKRKENIG